MRRPKPPCLDCDCRTDHCHNESCPYGWTEYQNANKAYQNHCKKIKQKIGNGLAFTTGQVRKKKRETRPYEEEGE